MAQILITFASCFSTLSWSRCCKGKASLVIDLAQALRTVQKRDRAESKAVRAIAAAVVEAPPASGKKKLSNSLKPLIS